MCSVSYVHQEIGDAISASTIPAMVTLIGSTQTGIHVMGAGATSIKRYSMELGGNAPVLVFADGDLDLAADVVCSLKFSNAGQICVAPNRVFVEESVRDIFTQKVLERAKRIQIGFDKSAPIDMGPVIDEQAWQRIDHLVKDAIKSGAELLTGGGRPQGLQHGHYDQQFWVMSIHQCAFIAKRYLALWLVYCHLLKKILCWIWLTILRLDCLRLFSQVIQIGLSVVPVLYALARFRLTAWYMVSICHMAVSNNQALVLIVLISRWMTI